ncbi:signal peptidase I [Arthrobacter sp. MP_M7]|uniref:signal peptidase I n=1 Tax=Arthrobacter sp. MP_M7 TaxID=3071716 RepID=UPI002E04CD62|nr:signal peptidase I [Arthrobacter sp. MP_M4]MEC5202207.1 signal peptidase I [Arthrobacter sp. MP_M7]
MPETGPRNPDPRGQDQPRVTSAAIPGAERSSETGVRTDPGSTPGAGAPDARATQTSQLPQSAEAASPASPTAPASPPESVSAAAPDSPAPDSPASGIPAAGGPAHAGNSSKNARRAEAQARHSPLFLWVKEVATVVLVAIVLSFLIKTFLFRAFYIPSESMVSTLDVNDRIFVNLLVPEPFALERGDVVVFRDTQGWLAPAVSKPAGPFTWVQDGLTFIGLLPDNSEQHLVKRVIGLPGDHVVCCDTGGRIMVNGAPLEETYINPAEVPQIRDFDVVVPDGKVWVMGDNRNHSADSRAHADTNGGFVDIADIEGRAAVIAWPFNRLGALDNYPDVFRGVPAPAGK